jgi:ATP-dependent DNA helicase RecQ
MSACVVHATMPKSVEAYQQETGRAGRDGLEAECVLLHSGADAARWARLIESPGPDGRVPSPESVAAQLTLLDQMQRLATGAVCRHKALSEHFGQAYPFPNCNACDVCLNEMDEAEDALVIAQKVISCVARAIQHSGFGFGAAHIVDVLRGSRARKIVERGHDTLSTHGILRDLPRPTLISYVNQLLDQGLLQRAPGEFATLTLNDASREVLRGERSVRLLSPPRPAAAARTTPEAALTDSERALFEDLRALRRDLADELNVPPYVVFADRTLRDMAIARPGSLDAMARIRGVGAQKIKTFGQTFVECIRRACPEHGLETDAPAKPHSTPDTPARPTRRETFARFDRAEPLEAVAEAVGLKPSTVAGHLAEWIAQRRPENIDAWVERGEYDLVASAADSAGADRLKPIYEHLDGRVPYERIRLVVAHLHARAD